MPAVTGSGETGSLRGGAEAQEPTRAQQVYARRTAESKAITPDFEVDAEATVDAAVAFAADHGATMRDVVVMAAGRALREHPRINGAYRDGRFERYGRVNVGVVIAGPEAPVAPTVFDADSKPLPEIAGDLRRLAERVRDGVITAPETSGGTFTVLDVGEHGARRASGVIHHPQAALLVAGAVEERPVVRDGEVAPGRVMALTLTCDGRLLYPHEAAAFLGRVRGLLEDPSAIAR